MVTVMKVRNKTGAATKARKTTVAKPRKRKGRGNLLGGFDASIEEKTALDQYLRDVSRHELITPDKEKELGALAQKGDQAAIQELARANLRFVISVAKKYQNRGVALTDLIQEGNVGLVTAARKFDPNQGVKFISYAVWWIRQAILASLANHGRVVRVPLNRASDLARIFREKERLKQELNREPTAEELAAELEWSEDKVESLIRQRQHTVSLETPVGDDQSTLVDMIRDTSEWTPDEAAMRILTREEVLQALEDLPPRLHLLLALRFGFFDDRPRTLEEVGGELGVTRERVRQLERQALDRLRSSDRLPSLEDVGSSG